MFIDRSHCRLPYLPFIEVDGDRLTTSDVGAVEGPLHPQDADLPVDVHVLADDVANLALGDRRVLVSACNE